MSIVVAPAILKVFLNLVVPFTSSFASGVVVPIPSLPSAVTINFVVGKLSVVVSLVCITKCDCQLPVPDSSQPNLIDGYVVFIKWSIPIYVLPVSPPSLPSDCIRNTSISVLEDCICNAAFGVTVPIPTLPLFCVSTNKFAVPTNKSSPILN